MKYDLEFYDAQLTHSQAYTGCRTVSLFQTGILHQYWNTVFIIPNQYRSGKLAVPHSTVQNFSPCFDIMEVAKLAKFTVLMCIGFGAKF